jgi:hypothetical protein
MSAARKDICAMVLVVLIAVPLAVAAGGESGPLSAKAGVGLVGGFVEQLKREDDEAERKELSEHEPDGEEREQAKEHTERVRLEESQAQEQAMPEGS